MGQNILRLRSKAKPKPLTQEALAELAGITRGVVAKLENGSQESAEGPTLEALARALGCSIDDLTRPAGERVDMGPLLEEFKASRQAHTIRVSDSEIEWLRGINEGFWKGVRPTPEALSYLVLAYRSADDHSE